MTALYILGALILVLFLAGQVRVGCRAEYSARGFFLWARLGPLSFQVFPWEKGREKKGKKPPQKKAEKKKPADGPAAQPSSPQEEPDALERVGGTLEYIQALLPLALEGAKCFYRRLRMDRLYLEITAGAGDPAEAALAYGRACAALGALWEPLTRAFHVEDGRGKVLVDFDAPGTRVYGSASLSIRVGQALWLGLFFGVRALRQFLWVRSQHKTAQQHRKAA